MAEPKYVVAMGACASGGGPFKEGYTVVPGIDKFLPVDVYIPGCPPTPQALLNGLMELQKVVDRQTIKKDAHWYRKEPALPIPIPILGPDLIDLRKLDQIRLTSEKPVGRTKSNPGRIKMSDEIAPPLIQTEAGSISRMVCSGNPSGL